MRVKILWLILVFSLTFLITACVGGSNVGVAIGDESKVTEESSEVSYVEGVTAESTECGTYTADVSCESTEPNEDKPQCTAALVSAVIASDDNYGVGNDIIGEIGADTVSFTASLIADRDALSSVFLTLSVDGGDFSISDAALNTDGSVDLLNPECKITVTDTSGLMREYTVTAEYVPLKLPVVSLNTEGQTIGREEYIISLNLTKKSQCLA